MKGILGYTSMLDAYLIREVTITNPETKLKIIFDPFIPIKVNPLTNIAWIEEFQVEISRQSYSLVQ